MEILRFINEEQVNTIKYVLRKVFDDPRTLRTTMVEIVEAMESVDKEMYEEMKSDLIFEKIISQ